MKNTIGTNAPEIIYVTIDKRLNRITEKPHNSKKIERANEILARVGLPDLEKIRLEEEAKNARQKADAYHIGSLIKQTRLKRQLSQKTLADLVGVDNAVISELENNSNTVSLATILQVFHVLDAELSFMVRLQKK